MQRSIELSPRWGVLALVLAWALTPLSPRLLEFGPELFASPALAQSNGEARSQPNRDQVLSPGANPEADETAEFRWFLIVRHAEKASEPKTDPPLTEYGEARAELLREMLLEAAPTTLLATELIRTQHTLEPIAAELGLLVDVHESDDPYGMALRAIELDQPVTVISAHSDTIVPIIQGLTGGDHSDLGSIRYNDFFVVAKVGDSASVLRLQYAPAG